MFVVPENHEKKVGKNIAEHKIYFIKLTRVKKIDNGRQTSRRHPSETTLIHLLCV